VQYALKNIKLKTSLFFYIEISPQSEWLSPRKQTITNAGKDVGKKFLSTDDGKLNKCSHCRNQYRGS
jgi:hypothetical protein